MSLVPLSFRRSATALVLLCIPACVGMTPSPGENSAPPTVLIVGGGESHDFPQWFQRADSTTLAASGARVAYVGEPAEVLPRLATADVLYQTANQPLTSPALREAVMRHVSEGKGLIIGHAGAWYNWSDWPEYNRQLVSGGARAHRRYGEFTVQVVDPSHPVMRGVPASFTLRDELYRFLPDSGGPARRVLATAREEETGNVYPIVFTVEHPRARILVSTLGHDGDAHAHPAYQRILQNGVRWASRRDR